VIVEDFFLQEVVEVLKKVVVGWRKVWRVWWVRQSFVF